MEIGDRCDIRLEVSLYKEEKGVADRKDSSTGELFAQVSYASPWNQVEPVLDSSRYFVLRVEGDGGKRAYIGMGFAERGDAFDFQVSPCQDGLGRTILDWKLILGRTTVSYETFVIIIEPRPL